MDGKVVQDPVGMNTLEAPRLMSALCQLHGGHATTMLVVEFAVCVCWFRWVHYCNTVRGLWYTFMVACLAVIFAHYMEIPVVYQLW